MAHKRSLVDLMAGENLSIGDLARKSGLSDPTVRRAVFGDDHQLNTTSAAVLAGIFGLTVGEINWPGGLANEGRPALSGGSYTRRAG